MDFQCPGSSKDFYLSLYKESDQNLIDGIESNGGEDVNIHMGLGIGRYYLKIAGDGVDTDIVNPYKLVFSDSPQTNLEIESNNTIKFGNAIEKDRPRKGRIFSSDDVDIYGFHLSETALFIIDFTPTTTTADYKVSLINENDQEVDWRFSSNGEACTINGFQNPGNFYI